MNYYSMILLGQLNFYAEMHIPMLLLMRRQERRSRFWLRLLVLIPVGVALAFMPAFNIWVFGMNYLVVSAIVFLLGWFLFRLSPLDVLFYTVAAFAVQHGLWDVLFIVYEGIGELTQPVALTIYCSLYLVEYTLFFFFFPVSDFNKGGVKERGVQFAVSFCIIIFVYVIASFVPWLDGWNILYRLYAFMCCVFALGLQCGLFEHGKLKERNKQLEQDKAVLQELLSREQKYYAFTKDTIDLINVKCHDLKHQIAVLKNMSEEEREKSLNEFEKAVMIYGNIAKTGNETLDTILTEKSFLCESYNIRFTYMIDGDSLKFMAPADILSLFGNALDNAIESVMKEGDPEKRIIKLNVSSKRMYLSVHMENYCAETLSFKNGIPETGKPDKVNHGFGVKSMDHIAKKYGGTIAMHQDGCIVSLDILLPSGGAYAEEPLPT